MSNSSKKVLITGLQGFTGRYLARELADQGHEVYGLGDQPGTGPRYFQANLDCSGCLGAVIHAVRPDWVVHLAALSFVGHDNPEDFYHVNLVGSRNLLAALARAPALPECILLVSSANIYGNAVGGRITEDTPPHPANDYAVSKLAMEYMARLWMPDLPLVITRPFNYTGIGQSPAFLLPKIVDHFTRGAAAIELGNLTISRDFCDVRAVVEAYRRLLEIQPVGQVVNICSGRAVSLQQVLAAAQAITGHVMEIKTNPIFVRANEIKTLYGDPARLRSIIGDWRTPPLEETLRWMIQGDPAYPPALP